MKIRTPSATFFLDHDKIFEENVQEKRAAYKTFRKSVGTSLRGKGLLIRAKKDGALKWKLQKRRSNWGRPKRKNEQASDLGEGLHPEIT